LNLFLFAFIVSDSGVSGVGALMGGLFLATSVDFLWVHTMAWSEPLCLFFGFLGAWFLTRFLRDKQRGLLIWSGACMAMAALTRYIGVAFGLGALVVLSHRAWKKKLPWTSVSIMAI